MANSGAPVCVARQESLLPEVPVVRERVPDPAVSHHLEGEPIHEGDIAPAGGEHGRGRTVVELLVDPDDLSDRQQPVVEFSNRLHAQSPGDERA